MFNSGATRLAGDLIGALAAMADPPIRSVPLLEEIRAFNSAPSSRQPARLAGLYLALEQFLCSVNPAKDLSREKLRALVRDRYADLINYDAFGLIFQPRPNQELSLCKGFLLTVLEGAKPILGASLKGTMEWVASVPDRAALPLPLGIEDRIPMRHEEWLAFMQRLSRELHAHLANALGQGATDLLFENAYKSLWSAYLGLVTFGIVVSLLPEERLDREKIAQLSAYRSNNAQR
ncbi:MAG: hypothetical protein AB1750_10975 [Chloroflexota bacterium]